MSSIKNIQLYTCTIWRFNSKASVEFVRQLVIESNSPPSLIPNVVYSLQVAPLFLPRDFAGLRRSKDPSCLFYVFPLTWILSYCRVSLNLSTLCWHYSQLHEGSAIAPHGTVQHCFLNRLFSFLLSLLLVLWHSKSNRRVRNVFRKSIDREA